MTINEKIMSGDIEFIHRYLSEDNTLGNILAIKGAVKNRLTDNKTATLLKKLANKDEWEFSANVSYNALAALDILGIKKYTGDNTTVLDMINNGDV